MNKAITLFLLLNFIALNISAQDDYVISDPKKTKKEFAKLSAADSSSKKNTDYVAYFINSTAYTLKKKQIRLSGTSVLFMRGSYGITDNTTASINVSLLGTLTGSLKQQINLDEMVKIGISTSGGILAFNPADPTINSDRDSNIFMIGGQVMATIGDKQDNITGGTGFYYLKGTFDFLENDSKDYSINTVYVGFQKQISKNLFLVGEGIYFINSQLFTGGLGVKVLVGDRIALNLGVMPLGFKNPSTRQVEIPIALPLISFRMLLGKH